MDLIFTTISKRNVSKVMKQYTKLTERQDLALSCVLQAIIIISSYHRSLTFDY